MIPKWLEFLSGNIPAILAFVAILSITTGIFIYKSEIKKFRKSILVLSIATAIISGLLGYLSHYEHEKDQAQEEKLAKEVSKAQKEIAEAHKETTQINRVINDTLIPFFAFEKLNATEDTGFVLYNFGKYSSLENLNFKFQSLNLSENEEEVVYDKYSLDFQKPFLEPGSRILLPSFLTAAMEKSDKHILAFTTVCAKGFFVQIMLLRRINQKWETSSRIYKDDSIYYETKNVPEDFLSADEYDTPYPDIDMIRKLAGSFKINYSNRNPIKLSTDTVYKIKTWASTDRLQRFKIEHIPGANFVKLTERKKGGYQFTRRLSIIQFSDSTICIECPNDKLYLQFHQLSNKLINSILAKKPEKSTLIFTWKNKKAQGKWAGIYIINKVKNKLGIIIQPNEREPIVYHFKEKKA